MSKAIKTGLLLIYSFALMLIILNFPVMFIQNVKKSRKYIKL